MELLGKPIDACKALFVPTGMYPFPNGAEFVWRAMMGMIGSRMCQLGWERLGLLELTALPSVDKQAWRVSVEEADAILVWGGDPVYLSYWMRESGLAEFLRSMERPPVYVGVSAGAMAATGIFAETYRDRPNTRHDAIASEEIVFQSQEGEVPRTLVTARGAGFVDFAVIAHYDNPNHPDASVENAEVWAAKIPAPVYAIDEQTAIRVEDGRVDVISEGEWKLFQA